MTDISPRYTVTDLGVLPGFAASRATALNDRGQVIGSLSHEEMDTDPLSATAKLAAKHGLFC